MSFFRFLKSCGTEMTCLHMGCCRFLDDGILEMITKSCPNLQGNYFQTHHIYLAEISILKCQTSSEVLSPLYGTNALCNWQLYIILGV